MTKKVKTNTKKKKGITRFTSFLSDGMVTERDFLLIMSAGVFFLFVSVALILVLFQFDINSMYISLLDMVSEVMMTIVISVFGLGGVEKVTDYLGNRETLQDKADAMERIDEIKENAENVYEIPSHDSPVYEETQQYGNEDDPI